MNRLVGIGEAAKHLGVSISTLRRWETENKIVPERTQNGHRRYDLNKLTPNKFHTPDTKHTLLYARVSSHDQKDDLARQVSALQQFATANGWSYVTLTDLGSGMNYRKKGLTSLISMILNQEIDRLVITHRDRLLRFGAELIFSICEMHNIEVVIINRDENTTFEEDLVADVLEIITVFSARLYGARSRKAKKLIEATRDALD